jgi:DNA-binding HxlR family transcriptional regulator
MQVREPRRYDERCGVAHALDLVGQRWALLVIRELLLGPKRYGDLRTSLPRVAPDVLSRRLRDLEKTGVIHRRKLPPPAGSKVYELTPWGRGLEPAVVALGRWGGSSPHLRPDAPVGADSMMLGVRTFFDQRLAPDLRGSFRVVLGDAVFTVLVDDDGIHVHRREDPDADASLSTDPETLAAVLTRSETLSASIEAGRAVTAGEIAAIRQLIEAVRLPDSGHVPATALENVG